MQYLIKHTKSLNIQPHIFCWCTSCQCIISNISLHFVMVALILKTASSRVLYCQLKGMLDCFKKDITSLCDYHIYRLVTLIKCLHGKNNKRHNFFFDCNKQQQSFIGQFSSVSKAKGQSQMNWRKRKHILQECALKSGCHKD